MLLILFGGLINLRAAHAHGYLVRSIPQDRSVVSRSPSRVQLWFSEGLEPKYSTLTVSDQTGQRVDLADSALSTNNRAQLSVRLPPNLPDGAYVATMRVAFSSDGHIQTDTLVFWIGQKTGEIATSSSSQDVYPVEVVARGVLNIGLMVLFGTLFIYRFVLFPAWRNRAYRAGGLTPRVMTTLYRLAAASVIAALAACAVWLVEQASVLFSAPASRVVADALWLTVLNTTQFGETWKLRMILISGVAGLILAAYLVRERQPALVYPLWSVALIVSGASFATMSLVSHAPGATLWPLASIAVDWLHLLAAGAWVGGVIALVWGLRAALDPLEPEGRRLALLAALRRFSPAAVVAVGVMAATGAYSALLYLETPTQIVQSAYGRTFVAKLILVAPLLLLGLLHNRALQPGRFKAAERWIGRSLRIETGVGVSVLLFAALLTATPPPTPSNARANGDLPSYAATVNGLTLTLTPNPGAVGANSYDLRLAQGDTPLDNAKISVQFAYPDLDKRSPLLAFDSIGDGLYVQAGAEINRPGRWLALFNVAPPGTDLATRFAIAWEVPLVAGGSTERQAGLLNGLSVMGLIAVFGAWIIPPLRRKTRTMVFERQSVLVGVGVTILSMIVMGIGGVLIANAARAFDEAAAPRPRYINPILPDQAAIEGGSALAGTCDVLGFTGGNPVDYLKIRTDSDLYAAFERSAEPGCRTLTETGRWQYIAYLRFRFTVPS